MPLSLDFMGITGLSLRELQLLLSLDIENERFYQEKIKKARILKKQFQYGSEEIYCDPEKAAEYRKIYKTQIKPVDKNNQNKNFISSIFNLPNLDFLNGWFTSIRLFISRIDKVYFTIVGRAFLPRLFSIGGFSYGVMLIAHLVTIIKAVFFAPITKSERGLSFSARCFRRFKTLLLSKKGFLSRIINDLGWFVFNLTTFILTGGVSVIVNVCGFFFDVILESSKAGLEKNKCMGLENKITTKIAEENKALVLLKQQFNRLYALWRTKDPINDRHILAHLTANMREIEKKIENKKKEINDLNETKAAFDKKDKEMMKRRLYIVGFTFLAFVGVLLVSFPPTTVAGALIIGSSTVLLAGSIMQGFGKRLYDRLAPYLPKMFISLMNLFCFNKKTENKKLPHIENVAEKNLIPLRVLTPNTVTSPISIPQQKEEKIASAIPSSSYESMKCPLFAVNHPTPILTEQHTKISPHTLKEKKSKVIINNPYQDNLFKCSIENKNKNQHNRFLINDRKACAKTFYNKENKVLAYRPPTINAF